MSYIEIDEGKCKACYLCVDVCPKKLIKKGKKADFSGNFPVEFIDEKGECLGCAMCATRCPDLAITKVVKV